MLVFVVPLQSAKVARSWNQVLKLLERTVRSLCAQTSDQFKVIVVCHEKPTIAFSHPNLMFAEVNFPPPQLCDDAGKNLNRKRTDKGRKMLFGLMAAKQFNPTHTMLVDADDCVSKNLASFVEQHPQANGWFINKGYRYEESSNKLYLKKRFYTMCGTCNILRYDLNRVPEQPEYNRGYGYYKYYIDHAKVRGILAQAGCSLSPLPFTGAVYMTETGENLFFNRKRLAQGFLRALNLRPLNPAVRDEFGIYSISA